MPEIKVKHVVSFSSEDKVFKAENLLKPEAYRKWKCATPGEKNASVILQFEKSSLINSIDIGNENSAFIEILVGRSSDSSNNYEVLLVSSSFMSPLDSRNGTHSNRVRIFSPDKLVQNVRNEKWDIAKVVCSQPFNKDIQYGLSFIKFHSPEDPNEEKKDEKKNEVKFGAFTMKEDDQDELKIGKLFEKRNAKPTLSDTGALAIRQATFAAKISNSDVTPSSSKQSPKEVGNFETFDSRDISVNKPPDKRKYEDTLSATKKCHPTPSVRAKRIKENPCKIMEKVVFALSGFKNPLRSTIRDKALEMGAKYEVNWNESCTHLVCAFANTPKFIEVNRKGGCIVKKEWIFDSYNRNKLLPWKRYTFENKSTSTTEESDESESEESPSSDRLDFGKQMLLQTARNGTSKCASGEENMNLPSTSKHKYEDERNVTSDNSDEDDYNNQTDCNMSCSSGDTEDEIRKVESLNKQASKANDKSLISSPLRVKHEVYEQPLPQFRDFFQRRGFFLYGNFENDQQCSLERFITSHNGRVYNYLSEDVIYVVTSEDWNRAFDMVLEHVNDNLIFVRPNWLYKCLEMDRRVPYQPYIITPNVH